MKLRKELEPNIKIVSELYPIVKKKILNFTDFWDNNPDNAILKHKEVEEELKILTSKDMSNFNLWEYWEADGIENLAFRISLPNPTKVSDFKKSELKEILTRIKTFEKPTEYDNDEISMLLWANKSDYYKELIKVNFDEYDFKFFIRNKDKKGNYFEYSVNEIIENLWKE
ncbi:hypothetical protein H0I23_09135 [Cellulophaga sp. HaHaR_3_176]|uniref:hypothetical protein n=1 Tax=Cellulophaga sp. HaHaR_3_176 TaxID=1942464 RepID=UPI001C1FE8E2|nr:hypothetical protein [Cellulophaga sp. HaHaR_3_176]QWX82632.1 hypothetical protein H0I23_09135 [Cellulophaga sp. HaHaR_3_176]